MRANCTAYFHVLTRAQGERNYLTGGGLIKRLLVRGKALNIHIMALCVNQLKEARGRRGVCVWVLLCMSGASFLCVHSSPIVSRHKLSTPGKYEDDLSYSSDSLQISPYRKVVANPSQKVTKNIKMGLLHRLHIVATATFWRIFHMMEKFAQAGEDGECTPTPFHYIFHHVQSWGVRSSWEGR